MNTYAAKLLFQFRITVGGVDGKRRACEERITLIKSRTARQALAEAKRRGAESEHDYTNNEGSPVQFEFVGVMDLMHLGIECEPSTVWYDITDRLLPFERRKKILPAESQLSAIVLESKANRSRK